MRCESTTPSIRHKALLYHSEAIPSTFFPQLFPLKSILMLSFHQLCFPSRHLPRRLLTKLTCHLLSSIQAVYPARFVFSCFPILVICCLGHDFSWLIVSQIGRSQFVLHSLPLTYCLLIVYPSV